MYITTNSPTVYKLSIQETRRKICNTIIQSRFCGHTTLSAQASMNNNLQLQTSSFTSVDDQLELFDVRLPLYLKIYYRKEPDYLLLECWRVVFESSPYELKQKADFKAILIQLAMCIRVVYSYALLIPAHKLIRQRNKLNQNFIIEYQLSNNFEKSDFKYSSVKDQPLVNILTEEGGFSVNVSFLSDLSFVQVPNYIQISTNDYSSRNRQNKLKLLKTYPTAPELTIPDHLVPIERSRDYDDDSSTPKNYSAPSQEKSSELRRSYTIPLCQISKPDPLPIEPVMDDIFTLETPTNSSFNSSNFNPFREPNRSVAVSGSHRSYKDSNTNTTSSSEGVGFIGYPSSTPGVRSKFGINQPNSEICGNRTSANFSSVEEEDNKEGDRKQQEKKDVVIAAL